MKKIVVLVIFIFSMSLFSQETEVNPPFHIKTISFTQNNENVVPIFSLSEGFQLQFDDLHANEENYYYQITHCNYDWTPSQLSRNEYLSGFDDIRIQDYANSLNTLQVFSHYIVSFPNKNTQLKVSGNYIFSILNNDKEIVFSRKIIIYENLVTVPIQIKRARNVKDNSYKHNMDFTIRAGELLLQNPIQNLKVMLLQNSNLSNPILNIKPQYTLGSDFVYKYDAETQFWAGNEYLYFENKNIRGAVNSVAKIDTQGGLYNCYLFTNGARSDKSYTFFPDINGNFFVRNTFAASQELESDYAWVYFSLDVPKTDSKNYFVNGMFNNFKLTDDNKMSYNEKSQHYEKAIMIKQGFTNYNYISTNQNGQIDFENCVDGNFYQTENEYTALIYYRANNQRFDRIIGRGTANSTNIIN